MIPPALRRIHRRPRLAIWELTSACNLRCLHCEASAGRRRPDEVTTGEALALCDSLAEAGCEQCNVSGGEPLLRSDWQEICQRLVSRGIRVTLVTNGMLLDGEAIQNARDVGVRAFALSLDGLRDTHDRIRPAPDGASSHAGVFRAVRLLREASFPIAVITQVNRWNLAELRHLHSLLGSSEVSHWQVQLGLPLGRMREAVGDLPLRPEDLPVLAGTLVDLIRSNQPPTIAVTDTIGYFTASEPVLRRSKSGAASFWSGCYAGALTVGIDANGDIKGCSCLPKEFVAGNVRNEPFRTIWDDPGRFAYNLHRDETALSGACARCEYRRVCRAGCTALAYASTGSTGENAFCLHRLACSGRREAACESR